MPKEIGSIKPVGRDRRGEQVWDVLVETGPRDRRKSMHRRVHGSRRDAELAAELMRRKLDNEAEISSSLTLDEYFYGFFIPALEAEGRANVTVKGYERTYASHISPKHGTRRLSSLRERDVRRLIRDSAVPNKVLVCYRTLLNRAKDDNQLRARMDLRGIKIEKPARKPKDPWTAAEALEAFERLRGHEATELAFLIGMSGLRKEEILAIRPCNMRFIVRALPDGRAQRNLVFEVRGAYTDDDGEKGTKTEESVRTVAAVPLFQERILELVEGTKPELELVEDGCWKVRSFSGWKREARPVYEERGLVGTREEVERTASKLYPGTGWRGFDPKLEHVRDDVWKVRAYRGTESTVARTYAVTAEFGSEEEVREAALAEWRSRRLLPCSSDYLAKRWKRDLEVEGLRYIPVSQLRHTSESIMVAGGVSATTVQKLHGHSTFNTDYRYYVGYGDDVLASTADTVGAYLESAREGAVTGSEDAF